MFLINKIHLGLVQIANHKPMYFRYLNDIFVQFTISSVQVYVLVLVAQRNEFGSGSSNISHYGTVRR